MTIKLTPEEATVLQKEMAETAREEWGEGLKDGFYENVGAAFAHTARWFIEQHLNKLPEKESQMSKLNGTALVTTKLYDCPACKQPVNGSLSVGIDEQVGIKSGSGKLNIEATITGCRANAHDCIPKVTR